MQNKLELWQRCSEGNERLTRTVHLDEAGLTIGRSRHCDLVVHAPGVADREALVYASGGTVFIRRMREGRLSQPQVMGIGLTHDFPSFSLRRRCDRTEVAVDRCIAHSPFWLRVGERRIRVDTPMVLGRAEDCDVVLHDDEVGPHQMLVAPTPGGVVLRNWGANRVRLAGHDLHLDMVKICSGARLKVGKTLLRIDPEELKTSSDGLVFTSESMRLVEEEIRRMACLPWPVMIQGESGSGKELVARALHEGSPRSDGPFVPINCGGLSAGLVESELFGYRKGAFTGAHQDRKGAFQAAHGGTLFLDEVAELPLVQQAHLLRVLSDWKVRSVGDNIEREVDVRLVCASHKNLWKSVKMGEFREDLFYRIQQLKLSVPPLRERPEDIKPLCEHFLTKAKDSVGCRRLSQEALGRLTIESWEGNVRQLRNVVLSAASRSDFIDIGRADIERALLDAGGGELSKSAGVSTVLAQSGGNVSAAARLLGIPRSTLRDRIKRTELAAA